MKANSDYLPAVLVGSAAALLNLILFSVYYSSTTTEIFEYFLPIWLFAAVLATVTLLRRAAPGSNRLLLRLGIIFAEPVDFSRSTPPSRQARRARLLNIVLIVFILAGLIVALDSLNWILSAGEFVAMGRLVGVTSLVTVALLVVLLLLNRWRSGWWLNLAFLFLITAAVAFSDEPRQVVEGRSLFFQILPILFSGFLLRPSTALWFSVLIASISAGLSLSAGLSNNSTAMIGFFLLGFLTWLVSSNLEHAIDEQDELNRGLDARVQERTRQLREANEFKSQFLRRVVHDLESPITAIQLTLQSLAGRTDAPDPQLLAALLQEGQRSLNLLKDLSRMSQEELASNRPLDAEPVDLGALARSIVTAHRAAAEEKGVALQMQAAGDLAPAAGDQNLLGEALTNLIGNAVKYTPSGGRVKVFLEQAEGYLVCQVQDTGIGIPAEDLEHLFEADYRAGNVGEIAGSGLGLSITREIVESCGGVLSVESAVGEGSTFTMRLPVS